MVLRSHLSVSCFCPVVDSVGGVGSGGFFDLISLVPAHSGM